MGDPILSTENLFFFKRSPKSGEKRMVIFGGENGIPRACSTSLVTYLKCFTKHLKNLLKSFPMVLDRSLQTLVDIKDKSPLKVILEMDFKNLFL